MRCGGQERRSSLGPRPYEAFAAEAHGSRSLRSAGVKRTEASPPGREQSHPGLGLVAGVEPDRAFDMVSSASRRMVRRSIGADRGNNHDPAVTTLSDLTSATRSNNDPTMPTEFLAAFDTLPRDARDDPPRPALLSAGSGIVGLVGVQLVRTASRSPSSATPQRRNGIEGGRHHDGVVSVGPAQAEAERRAARVGDEVALCARLAPVRRVRAGGRLPFLAGTDALSRQARFQSISPAACRRSSST